MTGFLKNGRTRNVNNLIVDGGNCFCHLSAWLFRLRGPYDDLPYRGSFQLAGSKGVNNLGAYLAVLGTEGYLVSVGQ